MTSNMDIKENYLKVVERITTVARRVGRDPESIRLVVVTKTQPLDIIQNVIDAGAKDFGENYVEEAIPKINAFINQKKLIWHMVGHVQSRKSPYVCDHFDYLHSLDSLKLAQKLDRYLTEANKILPVWLEFNVAGEETKSGWNISNESSWQSLIPDFKDMFSLQKLMFLGVMTIPPYSPDQEMIRGYYRKLLKFKEFIKNHFDRNDFNELSIGMSGDYEIAIQEGSTCVRIGQAIFGPRRK